MTVFEIRNDPIEVTRGGVTPYGPPPDLIRRFVAGPPRYFIDDQEVTEDEFNDQWSRAQLASSTERSTDRL